MHDFLAKVIKHNKVVQFVYRKTMSWVFKLCSLFIKVDPRLVLLSSFGGDQYSDSPKVLYNQMKNDPRFKGFKYVWVTSDNKGFVNLDENQVKVDTLSYFFTALKAGIWITNVNIERGLHFKNKKTIYLNTWHGTGPKKGGNAVRGRSDYDFSNVDIFCADGSYTEEVFSKWFKAKKENMLFCGRPREDELYSLTVEDTNKIKKKLLIDKGKKIILYMPTWREYGNKIPNWRLWYDVLGDNYVVLVRAHHFAKKEELGSIESNFLKDVSDYDNVNELYWVADVLVSDYSSAFFDFGLLGKPMFCYAYDYDKFKKTTGLFMDLENEFPNGIFKNDFRLVTFIKNMNLRRESQLSSDYCSRYVSHPQNATRVCLDKLYEKLRVMGKA